MNQDKPSITYQTTELPSTNLHYVRAGSGPSMIVVPATISELDDWIEFVQFLGQKYTVYFFELPGHGDSKPFEDGFSSTKVAEMIEELLDHHDIDHFHLCGFSFGGILTLKILERLSDRVDKLVILAPCTAAKNLNYSRSKGDLVLRLAPIFRHRLLQNALTKILNARYPSVALAWVVNKLGKFDHVELTTRKFRNLKQSTVETLTYQIEEVLTFNSDSVPLYDIDTIFAMSEYDPIINYRKTDKYVDVHFPKNRKIVFDFKYHQPPKPFTFDELNRDYKEFIDNL